MSKRDQSYPRAILHVDGDAFFASCEIAMNPALRGKSVVTGKERGIVSSMTYDVKQMGVRRGAPIHEALKICPSLIVVPSDYEAYSAFARRMYDIVRRVTPEVEEYSIDECFADLTGHDRAFGLSYEALVSRIKHELESELGITFSVGLGPNKTLAKVASKWNKPSGRTLLPLERIHSFLEALQVENVWGIGPQTSAFLHSKGVVTAGMYASMPPSWISEHMAKPYQEIYEELRGTFVFPLSTHKKREYQSMSKTGTFTPPSSDPDVLISHLSKNVENACAKLRWYGLSAEYVSFFLKTETFQYVSQEGRLPVLSHEPHEIMAHIRALFPSMYRTHTLYRATGVTLSKLAPKESRQSSLFYETEKKKEWQSVYHAVDALDQKFGKHTVHLGSSLSTVRTPPSRRTGKGIAEHTKYEDEGVYYRRLSIPHLGDVV